MRSLIAILLVFFLFSSRVGQAYTTYDVRIQSYNGQYLSASGGGGGPVYANRSSGSGGWETFRIVAPNDWVLQNGDAVYIQAKSGQYLCDDNGEIVNANRTNAFLWETWKIVKVFGSPGPVINSGDQVGFQAYTGHHMVADYDSPQSQIKANRAWLGGWESFRLTFVKVYDRAAAANYARRWAGGTNPTFGRFGFLGKADCTNFVSQCLRAGGWVDRWGTYGNRADSQLWFFDSSKKQGSYSWGEVLNFLQFASYSGRAYQISNSSDLDVGDVVTFKWNGDKFTSHAAIVTRRDADGTIYLCQHSEDRYEKRLRDYPQNASAYYWHLTENYAY